MTNSVAVLLGAGASCDARLPMSTQMTQLMTRHFNEELRYERDLVSTLNYVVGVLIDNEANQGGDPFAALDIERVMSAVELLSLRDDLEISPFVYLWNPSVDRPVPPSRQSRSFFTSNVKDALGERARSGDLERLIREVVRSEMGDKKAPEIYQALLDRLRTALVQLLTLKDADLSYLDPLADLAKQQPGLPVATLNYDLTIETIAETRSVPCDRGIGAWETERRLRWSDAGIRLLKLHGSIDWMEADAHYNGLDGYLPEVVVKEGPLDGYKSRPSVIFGGRSKLRPDGPYLDLLAAWASMLDEANALLIIGYSFRDSHVNETIVRWINNDPTRRIVVLDPSFDRSENWKPTGFNDVLIFALEAKEQMGGQKERAGRLDVVRKGAREGLGEAVSLALGE